MGILSHPFRLTETGAIATVDDGTTRANAEAIALVAATRRGERAMCPGFGVSDPTFAVLDVGEVQANLATYGPTGVTVTRVVSTPSSLTTTTIELAFEEQT